MEGPLPRDLVVDEDLADENDTVLVSYDQGWTDTNDLSGPGVADESRASLEEENLGLFIREIVDGIRRR